MDLIRLPINVLRYIERDVFVGELGIYTIALFKEACLFSKSLIALYGMRFVAKPVKSINLCITL